LIPKGKFERVENCAAGVVLCNEKGIGLTVEFDAWLSVLTAGICPQILWATLLITSLDTTQVLDLAGKWRRGEKQAGEECVGWR
jgi:hypothetical protein